MANVGHGTARQIIDSDGDVVSVTDNRLNVNAYLAATPTIDIGDVSLLLDGTAASTNTGVVGAQTLRVTMATDDVLLTAMNTNLADIETLLTTMDADTGNIVTNTSGFANSVSSLGASFVDTHGGSRYVSISGALRNDALENAIGTVIDGDFTCLQVNDIGALYVTAVSYTHLTLPTIYSV